MRVGVVAWRESIEFFVTFAWTFVFCVLMWFVVFIQYRLSSRAIWHRNSYADARRDAIVPGDRDRRGEKRVNTAIRSIFSAGGAKANMLTQE